MNKNYYEILDIKQTSDEAEIKAAYRKLARKFHPDVAGNSPETVKKFKDISEAYEILSDVQKRKNYDSLQGFYNYGKQKTESKSETKSQTSQKSTKSKETASEKKQNSNHDSQKFNKEFTNVWENFVGGLNKEPKEKQAQTPQPQNGADINSEIIISIMEAMSGVNKTINILHTEPCPKCRGRKFLNGASCSLCGGKGFIESHKKITVKIPPKIKDGAKIRLAEQGNKGIYGGKNGNLYIKIIIENPANMEIEGLNILKKIAITPFEAVLGGVIDVDIPEGSVAIKIMPFTVNGQKYRIAGKGISKDGKTGDVIITTFIDIPKHLSDEEIALYKKLRSTSTGNIREKVYG